MTLTPDEHEVARLIAAGMRLRDVYVRLGKPRWTVNKQWKRIRDKLGVAPDRRALAAALLRVAVAERRGRSPDVIDGFAPGDAVRIVGGRFAGRTGIYLRSGGGKQAVVQIGGGEFKPLRCNVRRIEDAQ